MITLLQQYSKEAVTVGGVLLAFVLNRVFRLRAKLIYSIRHSFNFLVDNPQTDAEGNVTPSQVVVRTASIFAQNTGLSPAKGVEFTFNWKPPIYNIAPPRHFTSLESSMGRYTVRLESLAPGEAFAIEIMSFNHELPILTTVRSDDAEGTLVSMLPTRQWPAWFNRLAAAIFAVGVAGSLYGIASLVQWLAR